MTAAQHRLLIELTGRISTRLATEFEKRSGPEGPNVGVTLAERGKSGRLEIPYALLQEAESDLMARDALRVRIKAARDRMLFRPPPARPRTDIAPLGDPAVWNRGNFGRGGAAAADGERMIHVMLPVQYLREKGARLAEPEKRLAFAVLQTVMYDCGTVAKKANGRARGQNRQAYAQAMAYVASRDRSWPYSFENLCETIGVDADLLRRQLAQGQVSSA